MRRSALAALLAFAVAMACFGILSSAVHENGVARVKAVEPSQRAMPSGVERRTCVPLEALHADGPSDFYVFVLEERGGLSGPEQVARKVSVSVAETDEGFAALDDGSLSSRQRVVARADKVLADGDRTREIDA